MRVDLNAHVSVCTRSQAMHLTFSVAQEFSELGGAVNAIPTPDRVARSSQQPP